MLSMNFKHDAVIDFKLDCQVDFPTSGRVIAVTENVVIYIPQAFVAIQAVEDGFQNSHESVEEAENAFRRFLKNSPNGLIGNRIEHNITVDMGESIWLDRARIVAWQYAHVPVEDHKHYCENVYLPVQVTCHHHSHYNGEGRCYGSGEFYEAP